MHVPRTAILLLALATTAGCASAGESVDTSDPESVGYWVEKMRQGDPAATQKLREFGDEAVDMVVRDMASDASITRSRATRCVASLIVTGKGLMPVDETLKQIAMEALFARLDDDAEPVRTAAAVSLVSLGEIAKRTDRIVFCLQVALSVRDAQTLGEAISALGKIGKPALAALTEGLTHPLSLVREGAAGALATLGLPAPDAVRPLLRCLSDESQQVRVSAARALAAIGANSLAAITGLVTALGSDYGALRVEATRALGIVAESASDVVEPLTRMLSDKTFEVRTAALAALSRFGEEAADALEAVIAAAQDKSAPVRRAAVPAMAAIGPESEEVKTALTALLGDTDRLTRERASAALAAIGGSLPDLLARLGDEDVNARVAALRAIGRMGENAAEAIGPLTECLKDAANAVRAAACEALGRIGKSAREAARPLVEMLKDPWPWVRRQAAVALGRIGTGAEFVVPALVVALSDEREDVRRDAATALAPFGPFLAPHIETMAFSLRDPDRETAMRMAATFRRIGDVATPALPRLRDMATSLDPDLRLSALDAIKAIEKQ